MKNIKVLDCTLRDGGCVNDFNFGIPYMQEILSGLEQCGVDIIECGYIDEQKGSLTGRTQYANEKVINSNLDLKKDTGIMYVAMIDYGRYNFNNLSESSKEGIDGIRLAFHKKDRCKIIDIGKQIISKGYKLFIQPMTIMRYSDKEILEFIDDVNEQLPEATAFYIVDSFGEMRMNDMKRIINLVDNNLRAGMNLGFHSHNNLQLSYSNSITLLQFDTNRNLIFDASVLGMGKGAGNLNTELFVEHLNMYYGKNYKIQPLLGLIDSVLNQIRSEFYWGYSVEYYLSSINHCTPSYASHFFKKHTLPIGKVAELLSLIEEDKKISFDKNYAEALYQKYNEHNYDDTRTVHEMKERLKGKTVLLIAPGKNVYDAEEQIKELIEDPAVVSFSLNIDHLFNADYILATKIDFFEKVKSVTKNIIVTSNVCQETNGNCNIINYGRWTNVEEDGIHDSALVIILNVLSFCEVKKVLLAGFDGFSVDINENYVDIGMRRPVTSEQAQERNRYTKEMLDKKRDLFDIVFLTKSRYQ